ncbi:molecular chaperone DnaJ [Prochlorococcus marinus]|uniref:Possible DnaJ domain n=1 Tax=Prochlorococcus marinus (strain MIT 9211) TaxID=93059 RepID=A9BAG1_PROM4|nr:molecular chaperone DnaJ [Prochlorococcus marinus]ABX08823.1 possible DnaJ domain [Prochlorococcus marinus str. MIT 9211]
MKVSSSGNDGSRRISVDLPNEIIERFDELKQQWGLRRRGAVLERLLEELLCDEVDNVDGSGNSLSPEEGLETKSSIPFDKDNHISEEYNEENAIVLISSSEIEYTKLGSQENKSFDQVSQVKRSVNSTPGIDLPGFVRTKTKNLRASLGRTSSTSSSLDPVLHNVNEEEVSNCLTETMNHWISLYGSKPKDNVLEAAMIWLARDIWSHIDGTENRPFTWKAATLQMSQYCSGWKNLEPKFDRIIVLAGVLEDPFATHTLKNRIPTLVRRFVNSFKRRHNVTSFQTLESTMTIHGALKLLDLPTAAGASLSLSTIRDSYKVKAVANHPDAGGSTETMRRINEAYQLLKELYRKK